MRPAILIILANLLAFGLGSIVTVWVTGVPVTWPGHALPAAPSVPPAGASATSSPAAAPTATTPASQAASAPAAAPAPSAVPAPAAAPTAPPATSPAPAPTAASAPEPSAPAPAPPAPAAAPAAPPPTMAASSPAPPPAASAQPATPAAAPPGGPYVLQLGAFHEASRAESLKATMQQHGYTAYLVTTPRFTIVRIGGYADRVAATRAAATLQANTRVRALILRTSDP